uniref:Uncharacterized protein n=1 Tax=Picea sitchensis TaxID=3332 RepID=A9NUW3_PICSI|nr:unknown [Picea sitchensis]
MKDLLKQLAVRIGEATFVTWFPSMILFLGSSLHRLSQLLSPSLLFFDIGRA